MKGIVILRLIPGGLPEAGDAVTVDGRLATVVKAGFSTHVFEDDVSIRYKHDGTLDLIPLELLNPVDNSIDSLAVTE